jgi:hypothetical protein
VNTITTDIKRRRKNTKYKWGKLSPPNTRGKWDEIPLTSLLETKKYNREFHLKFFDGQGGCSSTDGNCCGMWEKFADPFSSVYMREMDQNTHY